MSLEVDYNNYTSKERLWHSLESSIEADVGNQRNTERHQRALAMSMMDENDSDEIGSFKATPIEPDEDSEADEVRLRHAPAMSMMDENSSDRLVAPKEIICLIQLVGQFESYAVFIVWWLTCVARLQAGCSERVIRLGHTME